MTNKIIDDRAQSENPKSGSDFYEIEKTAQMISTEHNSEFVTIPQDWSTEVHPSVSLLRINFHGTHGDKKYIGIDGLEFYNAEAELIYFEAFDHEIGIPRKPTSVSKYYALTHGHLQKGTSWLQPISQENRLNIIFSQSQVLSMIRIWNYSLTPNCGAKYISIYNDSLLIYYGELLRSEVTSSNISTQNRMSQYILFTNDTSNIKKGGIVHYCGDKQRSIDYINYFD